MTTLETRLSSDSYSDMDVDSESPINISVYVLRPININDFLTYGTINKPNNSERINIEVDQSIVKHMGPVFNNLVKSTTDGIILLDTPHCIEYEDNILLLFKFIENVISLFSNEEIYELSQMSKSYNYKKIDNQIINKLQNLVFSFATNNDIFPDQLKNITTENIQKINDFGCLCDYLKIEIGILATVLWYRVLLNISTNLNITDIMDILPDTHKDKVYQIKREIYLLKNPCTLLEPSRKTLDKLNIDVDVRDDIDTYYQIYFIKQKFEEEQDKRFQKFIDEYKDKLGADISESDILAYATESSHLNVDDIEKIKFDYKRTRFINFYNLVKKKEFKLKRCLKQNEFDKLKNSFNSFTKDDIKDNTLFKHFYLMVTQ